MPFNNDDLCITQLELDQIFIDGALIGPDCIEGTDDDPQSNADASPFFEQEATDCAPGYTFEGTTC